MTLSRKEYLYQLSDLSENSHTAEYLVTVIKKVIEGIGEDRICAVVSDNAANVRNAQKIIHENHPKIENANAKLAQIIKEKGISEGGLKLYCKTRWTTASESKFFLNLRVLGFVLDPLRKAVLSLESRRATLADCFLSLARLAATLKKLPKSLNPTFRSHCIKVINKRFDEFDDDKYITCFFMDPRFRNAPLKKCALMRIIKCAASIRKNLDFDRYEAETLCDQIQKYINEQEPFDLDIGFAKDNPVNW
ncbi:unnamed protein product [Rhizophagus irregularis]|nr:unnamed protein product [Rhizophagus irregularis]